MFNFFTGIKSSLVEFKNRLDAIEAKVEALFHKPAEVAKEVEAVPAKVEAAVEGAVADVKEVAGDTAPKAADAA